MQTTEKKRNKNRPGGKTNTTLYTRFTVIFRHIKHKSRNRHEITQLTFLFFPYRNAKTKYRNETIELTSFFPIYMITQTGFRLEITQLTIFFFASKTQKPDLDVK